MTRWRCLRGFVEDVAAAVALAVTSPAAAGRVYNLAEPTASTEAATVKIEKPDDTNFILGQTHFIKSVEDIHEALVAAVPAIKFGLAFCEASGKCLVR
jgi:hypothetical protein